MKDFVLYLRNHNLRLNKRENFLAMWIAYFGLLLVFRQLDLSTAPHFVEPSLIVMAILGSLLFLSERSHMKEWSHIYDELINLIEREVSRMAESRVP